MQKKHWLMFGIIVIAALASDLISKNYIENNYAIHSRTFILGDLLAITPVYNTGSVFGGFQGNPLLFHILQGIGILVLFAYLLKTHAGNYIYTLGFAFVLGGALGNFTDKFFRKGVLDFIDMGIGSMRWYVYNVADVWIFIGFILLVVYFWKFDTQKNPEKETKNRPDET